MEKYKLSGKQKDMLVVVLFAAISLIFLMPLLSNIHNLGIDDWDGRFAYSAIPRESMLKYHQFPLWNPYICGGMPIIAYPESNFLSPFFIFILLFGEVIGLKILVLLHLIIGLVGMFMLSRHYGFGRKASFFSSIIFMMGSCYSLHISVGHTTDYLVMGYTPFAFLFYLKTINSRNLKEKFINATFSSFFILLMFLYGSTYLVAYLAMFMAVFSIIESIIRKKINPLVFCAIILVMGVLLSSIRLFPILSFLNDNDLHHNSDWEGNGLDVLFTSLLSRDQTYDVERGTQHGWWEYSAYIGLIPISLALLGVYLAIMRKKRLIPLILSSIFFFSVYFGNKFPLNVWVMLHKLPFISFFRVPSRVILIILLCTAILSAQGIDGILAYFEPRRKKGMKVTKGAKRRSYNLITAFVVLITAIVFIDLTLVSMPALSKAFPFEQPELESTGEFQSTNLIYNYTGKSNSYYYTSFLRNKGAMNSVDCAAERLNIPLKGSAIPRESPLYKGEAYLAGGSGSIRIDYFSPNRIIVVTNTTKTDRIVLNQNYYSGWKSGAGKAEPYNGLVSVPVEAGTRRTEIYYLPSSFIVGIIAEILVLTALIAASFMIFHGKKAKK